MQAQYRTEVYHAFAVQSTEMMTMDGEHFAVDWYWQEPCDIHVDCWYYWILEDISNPDMWYRAEYTMIRGIRLGEVMGPAHREYRIPSAVWGGSEVTSIQASFANLSAMTGKGPRRTLAWVCVS